jgi:hypothetical protein
MVSFTGLGSLFHYIIPYRWTTVTVEKRTRLIMREHRDNVSIAFFDPLEELGPRRRDRSCRKCKAAGAIPAVASSRLDKAC